MLPLDDSAAKYLGVLRLRPDRDAALTWSGRDGAVCFGSPTTTTVFWKLTLPMSLQHVYCEQSQVIFGSCSTVRPDVLKIIVNRRQTRQPPKAEVLFNK